MITQLQTRPILRTAAILGAAGAATVVTFFLVAAAAPVDGYIRALFFERSWIQYATSYFFWLAVATLAYNHLRFNREQLAYERGVGILENTETGTSLIWSDADRVRDKFADDGEGRHHGSVTFSRIMNALDRLRKTQSTKALEDYFSTRSDVDAGDLDTSYAGIRYLIWLIPTLGFIGTVMGIGVGIAGFADIIVEATNFEEVKALLPVVTRNLGTAFDTTLLALALSAVAVLYMSMLLKKQEHLLTQVDNLCLDDVCALFQEHTSEYEEVIDAVRDTVKQIESRMNGNRAEIVKVVTERLPQVLSQEILAPRGNPDGTAAAGPLERLEQSADMLTDIRRHTESQTRTNEEMLAVLKRLEQRLTDGDRPGTRGRF